MSKKENNYTEERWMHVQNCKVEVGDKKLLWHGETISNFVPLVLNLG